MIDLSKEANQAWFDSLSAFEQEQQRKRLLRTFCPPLGEHGYWNVVSPVFEEHRDTASGAGYASDDRFEGRRPGK